MKGEAGGGVKERKAKKGRVADRCRERMDGNPSLKTLFPVAILEAV